MADSLLYLIKTTNYAFKIWKSIVIILPYHAVTILDLKQGWTGIKIAKMANDNGCIPLSNNGTP